MPPRTGELTAVLDLVLAPVPARHQFGQERIELELLARPDHHGRGDAAEGRAAGAARGPA